MNKKSRKLLTWCLVLCMVLTQMLFTNVAFAANRYSGTNRYLTALEIVKNGWTKSDAAVIARGDELADALAAAPLAYAKGNAPILLTETNALPAGVMDELVALGVKSVYIVGGTGAVSADVEKALQDKFGAANVTRIAGANRVETAYKVAKEAFTTDPTAVVLANAYAYADALSVSSVAAAKGMPVLLVDGTMTPDVAAYVAGKTVYAVGGTAVLPDASLPAGAKRLSGANRYATNAAILTEFAADLDYTKVYVAKGEDDNLADALAGSALAALTKSPIVLADASNSVAAATNVLKANLKEDSTVVGLGGSAALADAALAAVEGLRPVATELKVESVSAINLRQLKVVFNKEVDEDTATDPANYELKTDGTADLTGANFELLSDGKTVLITLTSANKASQQEKVELDVEDVQDADGNVLAERAVFEDVEFLDTKLPQATKAEVVGNDTIKVTFDEPVTAGTDGFEVNDGDIYVKNVTFSNNDTEANVELYTTLDTGDVKIAVKSAVEDFAGFGAIPKDFTLNVVKDDKPPVVVGYKDAKPTEVTLVFDNDIEIADDDVANFYHTNTNNTVDDAGSGVADVDVDGNELTLHFTENPLPEGTAYVYIEKGTLNDLWDNENEKIMVKVDVTVDTTKPTLTKVEANSQTQIELTFSENVADVEKSDFTVLDSDGNKVTIKRATASDDTVTLDFYDELSGEYTITVEDVEDEAGNVIEKVSKTFNVDDLTAPDFSDFTAKLYKAGAKGQMLKVNFGEAMATDGKYAVNDLEKYKVGPYNLSDLDCNVVIKVVDGGKSVEITIPSTVDDADDGVDLTDTMTLVLARVADAAGNYTEDMSGTIDIESAGYVDIESVEATATDTVAVTFNDKLSSFNVNDLKLYVDTDNNGYNSETALQIAKVKLTTNDDGNSVATITLADASKLGADAKISGYAVRVTTVASPTSKNIYGEALLGNINTTDDKYTVSDSITPSVAEDSDGNQLVYSYDTDANGKVDTIVITYTENINPATVNKYTYSVDDISVSNAFVSDADNKDTASTDSTPAEGKFVVIKLNEADADLLVDTSYTPDVEQKVVIYDVAGNALNPTTDVISTIDNAGPVAISAEKVDDTHIRVSLSEDVTANKLLDGTGWTVTDSATTPNTYAVSAQSVTNDEIILTVANLNAAVGDLHVAYTTQANKNEDASGNDMVSKTVDIDLLP